MHLTMGIRMDWDVQENWSPVKVETVLLVLCLRAPYSLPLFITPLLYSPGWNDWNSAQFPAMQFYPFMTLIDFLPVLLFDLN